MNIEMIKEMFSKTDGKQNLFTVKFEEGLQIEIYLNSVKEYNGSLFFIGRRNLIKSLYILSENFTDKSLDLFEGEKVKLNGGSVEIKKCFLNHKNVLAIQNIFSFTKPVPIGLNDSFGFGDRLGLANAGHVRSLKGYNFKPIFAQQSIRELTRTNRAPEEVLAASVWAVFQEGYESGFGADADHLKTTHDIDLMVKAGYKTITIDPSEHIMNGVSEINKLDLMKKVLDLPWNEFQDSSANILTRYEDKGIKLPYNILIKPSTYEVLEACLKYCRAIIHIKRMCDYLNNAYHGYEHEIEVSIDETDTVTSPFEHYFIVNELRRLKVNFVSLAPRFVGDFEKGIDYKGDIDLFTKEYLKHVAIAEYFGFYKISFHSGSDKFKVYEAVSKVGKGFIHIKTAGTSYLEALKVIAIKEPDLFRDILNFAVGLYENEKKTYHVSADMKKIRKAELYKDSELEKLFDTTDVRQALHVTYGRVLTEKIDDMKFLFRDKIYQCLIENEELHYQLLVKHFQKHMNPFKEKE